MTSPLPAYRALRDAASAELGRERRHAKVSAVLCAVNIVAVPISSAWWLNAIAAAMCSWTLVQEAHRGIRARDERDFWAAMLAREVRA